MSLYTLCPRSDLPEAFCAHCLGHGHQPAVFSSDAPWLEISADIHREDFG